MPLETFTKEEMKRECGMTLGKREWFLSSIFRLKLRQNGRNRVSSRFATHIAAAADKVSGCKGSKNINDVSSFKTLFFPLVSIEEH